MTPRILYIITGLGTGGAEAMLWKVLAALGRSRWSSLVVSLRGPGTFGPRIEALDIPVVALGLSHLRELPKAAAHLGRIAREFRPSLIHGWMYHGNLAAVLARWAGGGRRPPLLWNIRQSLQAIQHEKPMTRGVIRAGARLSSLPSQIVYNAQSSADRHVQIGYRADRTLVIPNGFDTETFRPDPACRAELRQHLGLPPDTPIVGLVARWHPVKDHPTFLRAARRISDQMPAVHFVLAGRAVDRENPVLNGLIHELGLESRVHLLGNVADPSGLTAGFDIASCSSLSEAFPNVLGEALACGVPCVSTDVGDAAWIVGDAGVIVPPHDPIRFADACLELLSLDREAREAMGQRGRDRVRAQFGIDRIATRYAELYTTLVAG